MKRLPTLLPTLGVLSLLAACGGQDAAMDDMDMSAPAAAESAPAAASGAGGGLSCYLSGATPEEARQRMSPHTALSFNLGANPALLCYGALAASGAVPTGQPWPMGADEATTLHLSARANVGGVALQPGSYSLYAIPGADAWEFFINSNWQRMGTPIDAQVRSTEVGSFSAAPQPLPSPAERLTYGWEDAAGGEPGGEILMEWGNTLLRIPVEG
jgi:hypothetical protein